MSSAILFSLYYDRTAKFNGKELDSLIKSLKELSENLGIKIEYIERESLSPEGETHVLERIRSLKPQERGSIVSSKGCTLPLTKSKKLNVGNTPVLLITLELTPVYVFPCRLGERYYDISEGIEIIKANWPLLKPLEAESEERVVELIKNSPDLLEKGLLFLEEERPVPSGRIDLIFRDTAGKTLVIEVEREASDEALGQVLRLAAGYEQETGDAANYKTRAGIVCLRASMFLPRAAKRAGVELWELEKTAPMRFKRF